MSLSATALSTLLIAEDVYTYNIVASSMLVFWEHCIAFRQEIDLIWRSNWSPVSIIFCISRYLALCIKVVELVNYTDVYGRIHLSPSSCRGIVWFDGIAGLFLFYSVEVLLILRVFAFYGRSRRWLAGILILFVCEMLSVVIILIKTMPEMQIIPNPFPPNLHIGACLVEKVPPLFFTFWIPALIFQSFLFGLVAAKFIFTKSQITQSPRLLVVFVRDGAWAYALIFAGLLWATLAYTLSPVSEKGNIALIWFHSILAFSGPRMVLNLRSAAQRISKSTEDGGLELNSLKNNNLVTSETRGTMLTSAMDIS